MCIIAISPKNTPIPSYERREEMFFSNPDGAGFMFPRRGKVHIEKGFMDFQSMEARLDEIGKTVDLTATPIVFHYRIGTHGGNIPQNTHPFPVSHSRHALRELTIDTWLGCVHNGIIFSMKPRKGYSDTQEYIVQRISHFRKNFTHDKKKLARIERETDSKLAFLSPDGEITTVGDFIHDKDGCLYSNRSYDPYRFFSKYATSSKYKYENGKLVSIDDNPYKDWTAEDWMRIMGTYVDDDDAPEYNPDTYVSSLKSLEDQIVVDGNGDLRDGAEFCCDAYGRLYEYASDGTARLDSRARVIDSGSHKPLPYPYADDWGYDDYDQDDWADVCKLPF